MTTAVKVLLWTLVVVSFGLAAQLPLRISSATWQLHVPKAAAQALASYLVVAGLLGGGLAVVMLSRGASAVVAVAAVLGLTTALLSGWHVARVSGPDDALAGAFGPDWKQAIPTDQAAALLPARWRWALPGGLTPTIERDVVYAKVPETDRELHADVWQPPHEVASSGLGFVYVHGGYYQLGGKDFGTRPLFRHLTRQGHVVMDIDYRLVDETNIFGMVDDVKRAVAWLQAHARSYGVDPTKIVVAGGSAGGNLALLAAYTSRDPQMTPDDIVADIWVHGVVAYYGVHDWPAFAARGTDDDLALRLLGGTLEEAPDRYRLASPVTHVDQAVPPTLLVQGLHDQQHLIDASRRLNQALTDAGRRVVLVELPGTDHAFDIMPPGLGAHSPPAISATYALERFLAVLAAEPDPRGQHQRRPRVAATECMLDAPSCVDTGSFAHLTADRDRQSKHLAHADEHVLGRPRTVQQGGLPRGRSGLTNGPLPLGA